MPGERQEWARLLPDFLRPHGYRSYHSGKWHIDGNVLPGGFDRSLDVRNSGNFFTARGTRLDDKPVPVPADESGYYATTATADHAITCLKDHAADHADKPFFQYIAFHAPHFPLHALPEDIAKYKDNYLDGWDVMRDRRFARQRKMGLLDTTLSPVEPDIGPPYAFPDALKKLGPGEVNRPLPWADLTDEQRRFQATKMAIHAAMVDRMDREIGRLVAQLKAMGAFENTIIMFASDNGASAEIMVRDGGHDPDAPPGSAASYLCLGPGFSMPATPRSGGTRRGSTRAGSAPRWSPTGRPESRPGANSAVLRATSSTLSRPSSTSSILRSRRSGRAGRSLRPRARAWPRRSPRT